MSYVDWPKALPGAQNSGYQFEPDVRRAVSEMEVGAAEVQVLSSQYLWSGSVQLKPCTNVQWAEILQFYFTTINITGKFYFPLNTGGKVSNHLVWFLEGQPPIRGVKSGRYWHPILPLQTDDFSSILGNEL